MLAGGRPKVAAPPNRHNSYVAPGQLEQLNGSGERFVEAFGARHGDLADFLEDMISVHAPDGTYRYASAACTELLGYRPSELIGRWAYDLFHPDDVSRVSVAHRNALDGSPDTVAYRLRRKDGSHVWVETTTKVIYDEGGFEVVEILCCTRELSDREVVAQVGGEEHQARLERVQQVLAEEAIDSVFQPVIELASGRPIAYEALTRFPGEEGRNPGQWFADAAAVGLGVPMELLAIRMATKALPQLPEGIGLSVNASPSAVCARGFMRSLGGDADRITVELTEHLAISDYTGFGATLAPLREAGGSVAIDDFGAGYASLRHILMVRPEWIKLDISLTERIDEDSIALALATALISFAGDVGVRVIAEGIETADQLETLEEIGFEYGQGFHFGVPAPLDEALAPFSA